MRGSRVPAIVNLVVELVAGFAAHRICSYHIIRSHSAAHRICSYHIMRSIPFVIVEIHITHQIEEAARSRTSLCDHYDCKQCQPSIRFRV